MAPVPEEEEGRTPQQCAGWQGLLQLGADTRRLCNGSMRQLRCCITAPLFTLLVLCPRTSTSILRLLFTILPPVLPAGWGNRIETMALRLNTVISSNVLVHDL